MFRGADHGAKTGVGESMKNWLVAALALLAPGMALASPIDGTWRIDASTAKLPEKPDVFLIKDGVYRCRSCTPPVAIKADGTDHPIKGDPYTDMMAITLGARSVTEADKKAGKTVYTSVTIVSADGKTAATDFTDTSSSTTPVTGKVAYLRVAPAVPAEHPFSGSWRETAYSISNNHTTVTYETHGDMLTMLTGAGHGYTAKMDGTPAPYRGDPGADTVSVRKTGASLVESLSLKGKTIRVYTITPAPDGKTFLMKEDDTLAGTSLTVTARRL
jgi:hypothetical protein